MMANTDTNRLRAWWEQNTSDEFKSGRHLLQHDEDELDKIVSYGLPIMLDEIEILREVVTYLADGNPQLLTDALEASGVSTRGVDPFRLVSND